MHLYVVISIVRELQIKYGSTRERQLPCICAGDAPPTQRKSPHRSISIPFFNVYARVNGTIGAGLSSLGHTDKCCVDFGSAQFFIFGRRRYDAERMEGRSKRSKGLGCKTPDETFEAEMDKIYAG